MEKFWQFVFDNIDVAPEKLRLKYHGRDMGFDINLAITQIECRRKFGKKLALTLQRNPRCLFPSTLAGEQATSDLLADFHASLAGSATKIIDFTAGLGIDTIHFPPTAYVTAIDIEQAKTDAMIYNVNEMRLSNISPLCTDCREFAAKCYDRFDLAFIDPSRRAADGKRVFALSDCCPDVVAMLPDIRRIAGKLIVKMSPMLDISKTVAELPGTRKIIALGTSTECKELIAEVDFSAVPPRPFVEAVTLTADSQCSFSFTPDEEREADATYAAPAQIEKYSYLYEPSPAVMKAGPYRLLSKRYGIDKVASNTHIYLSTDAKPDFPGTVWKIAQVIPYESRYIKRLRSQYPCIQVTARNFPIPADALRAKLRANDSGPLRLFALTLADNRPAMIITERF